MRISDWSSDVCSSDRARVRRSRRWPPAAAGSALRSGARARRVAPVRDLLHRTTRCLSLTDDGQRFHARAGELVAAMEELETETVSSGGEAAGRLRLAPRGTGRRRGGARAPAPPYQQDRKSTRW